MEVLYDCSGLFDSHAHYFDRRFEAETDGADAVLARDVFDSGIVGVINVGTCSATNKLCIEQARRYPQMYAAVGIHPEDVMHGDGFEREITKLYGLVSNADNRARDKIVALGEIGLDYHYEGFDKQLQLKYFTAQMDMAQELDMPVIIHDRDAHGDCFETVIGYKSARGVFHSFSGSAQMAAELVKRGWYISFSGVLTFKNARKTVEVAQSIPLDRVLLETDAPYLAPHPHRGKINHSGLMRLTAQRLAEIKGMSVDDVIRVTRDNTKALFGI